MGNVRPRLPNNRCQTLITVQLLGRWGSAAVWTYLAETLLATISERLTCNEAGRSRSPEINCHAEVPSGRDDGQSHHDVEAINHKLLEMDGAVSQLSRIIKVSRQFRSTLEVRQVLNDASRVVREPVVNLSMPPTAWKTRCGWKFETCPGIALYRDGRPDALTARLCPMCNPSCNTSDSSSFLSYEDEDDLLLH